jgi:hypothetical protein
MDVITSNDAQINRNDNFLTLKDGKANVTMTKHSKGKPIAKTPDQVTLPTSCKCIIPVHSINCDHRTSFMLEPADSLPPKYNV